MKYLLTVIGLLIAATGAYYAYQQYELGRATSETSKPNIVVYLRSFSYSRSRPHGSGDNRAYVPAGEATFKLENKGGTAVTVTKVMFNPVGTWEDGRHGGMGSIEVELNKLVPGHGVIVVDDLRFSAGFAVAEKHWIDLPEEVNVRAYWAGGFGPMLTCIKTHGGSWSCD